MHIRKSNQKFLDKLSSTQYSPIIVIEPGEVVSVDQLVSPAPGIIDQMTDRLATKRYKYVTVFANQASKLGYIYLQKTNTVD